MEVRCVQCTICKGESFNVGDGVRPVSTIDGVPNSKTVVWVLNDPVLSMAAGENDRIPSRTAVDCIIACIACYGVVASAAGNSIIDRTASDGVVSCASPDLIDIFEFCV